jgi:hypothetical protein
MPKQFPEDRQAHATACANAGEGMAKIMDA